MHEYYAYSAEELASRARVPVRCMESSEAVFRFLAQEMIDAIEHNNSADRTTIVICPVGPVGHYPYFVSLVNERRLSLRNVWFFNMDEYLGPDGGYIGLDSSLSFRAFMEREVYGRIDPALLMPREQRVFPDPQNPEALTEKLASLGGADLCVGGLGINGHLAFNEPQPELSASEFAKLPTRVLSISPETRTANAIGDLGGALEEMPLEAVTIGMKEILASKKIRIGVFRPWHRAVLRRAACGEVGADFPATLLQLHPDAMLLANDIASGRPL